MSPAKMTVVLSTGSISTSSSKKSAEALSVPFIWQEIRRAENTCDDPTMKAIKEFSKSRLRKKAQTHTFRKPRRRAKSKHSVTESDFNSPLHHHPSDADGADAGNAIDLIKEEIAIMKKLNHPNLCALIEVLDDPREDTLYMVMEMCKKGIIMKLALDHQCDPYEDEHCRRWFRDLILGIEYLHAQGIVHRDIKPDNCLLTEEDVLKVVDFGVSEMFEKDSQMMTAKSAGSPAFLPPELCVVRSGGVHGKNADIWSMGVTLYCLRYGRLPFQESAIVALFEAIKTREPSLVEERDEDFRDLMHKILEKDAEKRIQMPELREHPWVTKRGCDPLISEAANTGELLEPPTDAEMESAITGAIANLLTVIKAVNKFKKLVAHKRPTIMSSILGEEHGAVFSEPPLPMGPDVDVETLPRKILPRKPLPSKSRSVPELDRPAVEGALASEGVHRDLPAFRGSGRAISGNEKTTDKAADTSTLLPAEENDGGQTHSDSPLDVDSGHHLPEAPRTKGTSTSADEEDPEVHRVFRPAPSRDPTRSDTDEAGHRGQAHDPSKDHLYLHIGPSSYSTSGAEQDGPSLLAWNDEANEVFIVSESPGIADVDIYETAYKDEIERIRQRCKQEGNGEEPTVYLNRRVDAKLMALGQYAGRFIARGEEGLGRFGARTGWRDKRTKVTDVSRALRAATREEYEKQRLKYQQQEGHSTVTDDDAGSAAIAERSDSGSKQHQEQIENTGQGEASPGWVGSILSPTALASKAMGKGRLARESFFGFMDSTKDREHATKDDKQTD